MTHNNLNQEKSSDRIQVSNLVKKYGRKTVVSDVSLDIKQGEIVGILGPNGAGKSTTFYMILGITQPNKGQVFYNDINITHNLCSSEPG